MRESESKRGSAAAVGIFLIAIGLAPSCSQRSSAPEPAAQAARSGSFTRYSLQRPESDERYCAWFGEARDGVLYFGESAFWSEFHSNNGDPLADLEDPGPQLIGRFDLFEEQPLSPIDLGTDDQLSGVWDVLPHPNGRVYFTSLFGKAGYADPATGEIVHFEAAGPGLNELALGPMASILASRYGGEEGVRGSVVVLDHDGKVVRELPLETPAGTQLEPKTIGYDPFRWQIWVTTDLLKDGEPAGSGPENHPAVVLDREGRELYRVEDVEVQFVRFLRDGTGYIALVKGGALGLAVIPPGKPEASLENARKYLLEANFPQLYDFVQDIQIADDGRVALTRWSGAIHVLDPKSGDEPVSLQLPEFDAFGLYYSAILTGNRLCATYCADVSVVCGPAPPTASIVE